MAAAEPIAPLERNRLLDGLAPPLAIAVSGGPDSMALLLLVAGWARARGMLQETGEPSPIVAITVDHGLRAGSDAEAQWVAGEARRLGLPHVTLAWRGPKPATGVQDAARKARYELLLSWIGRERLARPRTLLLAHHRNDQAETVLMRLARGSGIDGLSGMREVEERTWVELGHPVREHRILLRRPLLAVPKARLIATLERAGQRWVDDPSNRDPRFERVRLRDMMGQLAALGLDDAHLELSARRLAEARAALEAETLALARSSLTIAYGAYAALDREAMRGSPTELVLRLLQLVISAFGGRQSGPERPKLEALVRQIRAPAPVAATLGGALIWAGKAGRGEAALGRHRVLLYREPGRGGIATRQLKPGQGVFWDRRFYVSVSPAWTGPVRVGPLGAAGYAVLRRRCRALQGLDLPSRAAATLPAIWDADELLAVPSLGGVEPALRGPRVGDEYAVQADFAAQHIRAMLGDVGWASVAAP
jgi:tRNA(Ile)-lysidine synthase